MALSGPAVSFSLLLPLQAQTTAGCLAKCRIVCCISPLVDATLHRQTPPCTLACRPRRLPPPPPMRSAVAHHCALHIAGHCDPTHLQVEQDHTEASHQYRWAGNSCCIRALDAVPAQALVTRSPCWLACPSCPGLGKGRLLLPCLLPHRRLPAAALPAAAPPAAAGPVGPACGSAGGLAAALSRRAAPHAARSCAAQPCLPSSQSVAAWR